MLVSAQIMYCMRQHTIHKTYQEFQDLNDALAVEILLLPGFPQFSLPSRVMDPKALGMALAEYTTRFHHSLAARGVFSPRLMDFCLVDVHRVRVLIGFLLSDKTPAIFCGLCADMTPNVEEKTPNLSSALASCNMKV